MSRADKKLIRRIHTQTETVTITAQTKHDVTESEAIADLEKYIHTPGGQYRNFVVSAICTEEQWKAGNVNFCPRCGTSLSEYDEDDVSNEFFSECPECYANLDIRIQVCDGGEDE